MENDQIEGMRKGVSVNRKVLGLPPQELEPAKDGGPAFPPHHDPKNHPSGMTHRDYFAAAALQGLLAMGPDGYDGQYENAARVAYGHADAMIKATAA